MKGIAVAIFPSKDHKLLISYTELAVTGTKDSIKVGNNQTFEIEEGGRDKVQILTRNFTERLETVIPVVFGAHGVFQLTTEQLHATAGNIFNDLPQIQLHCRTFYPLRDLSEEKIGEETIYAMNKVFGAEIDFNIFTPEQDLTLEKMAKLWVSVLENDKESRFIGILPDDKYLITQILKKGGKWRERFGVHVCKHLGAKRNICVKPLGHNPNPPFSDVTATYIADILDLQTGEEPRIVEAIR